LSWKHEIAMWLFTNDIFQSYRTIERILNLKKAQNSKNLRLNGHTSYFVNLFCQQIYFVPEQSNFRS